MPSAAIGAVVAACIAAAVSLLGLIISKEQKTSEFRQAWIDALRADLAVYLTSVNAISDAIRHAEKSNLSKLELMAPLLSSLNGASFNISLRINRSEYQAKLVFAAMKEFESLFASGEAVSPQQLRPVEQRLLTSSQDLLRSEWKRVKSGEPTFQIAKYACAVVIVGALAYGAYFAISGAEARNLGDPVDAGSKPASVNIVISSPAEVDKEVSQIASPPASPQEQHK